MTPPPTISVPLGHLAITTFGMITHETVQSLMATQARVAAAGIKIRWQFAHGSLVDRTRNMATVAALADKEAGYILFLDADMVWEPDLIERLLATAYHDLPWADIVGGWCPLRGKPHLPTIDTGTGTWEPTFPQQGPMEVIRTGGACLLIKRHVLERMEPPWFGVRPAPRPLDMLAEFDNFCRIKFDGRNPFAAQPQWAQIQQCAMEEARGQQHWEYRAVGEDSNFCDKARALGFRIVVNTDAVCHHVDRKIITPADHRDAMREQEKQELLACGVTG